MNIAQTINILTWFEKSSIKKIPDYIHVQYNNMQEKQASFHHIIIICRAQKLKVKKLPLSSTSECLPHIIWIGLGRVIVGLNYKTVWSSIWSWEKPGVPSETHTHWPSRTTVLLALYNWSPTPICGAILVRMRLCTPLIHWAWCYSFCATLLHILNVM